MAQSGLQILNSLCQTAHNQPVPTGGAVRSRECRTVCFGGHTAVFYQRRNMWYYCYSCLPGLDTGPTERSQKDFALAVCQLSNMDGQQLGDYLTRQKQSAYKHFQVLMDDSVDGSRRWEQLTTAHTQSTEPFEGPGLPPMQIYLPTGFGEVAGNGSGDGSGLGGPSSGQGVGNGANGPVAAGDPAGLPAAAAGIPAAAAGMMPAAAPPGTSGNQVMNFPVPRASANWQDGVPPELHNQIKERRWAVVQIQGFDPVIYVNCLEGSRTVEILLRGLPNDYWQEAHVTGGSGGGAHHPSGVILLGPEGLGPFRTLLSTPPPPDNKVKPETLRKLNEGTLRLVPPSTYLKFCRVFKKGNTSHALRVVEPGTGPTQSVADFFQYNRHQAPNQAPQQSPQPTLQHTPANQTGPIQSAADFFQYNRHHAPNQALQQIPQPPLQYTPANNNGGRQAADAASVSGSEGDNAPADTANTSNAAAALFQMGAASGAPSINGFRPSSIMGNRAAQIPAANRQKGAAGGEGHAGPSNTGPGPSSNGGIRAAETPEERAIKKQRVDAEVEAVQRSLNQKLQAWTRAAEDADAAAKDAAAAAEAVAAAQRNAAGMRARAEQLRAAEAAADRELQSYLAVLARTGPTQGQP